MAQAAYQFDRVRIELSPKHPVDTIKLSNPGGDKPVDLQITSVVWTQKNGEDVYLPNKELIIAPPMMKIPPGGTQIVRIGWRRPMPITQELAYRINIEDFTPITDRKFLIQFKVTANIPVFVRPLGAVFNPQWQIKRMGNNHIQITLTNKGNIHIQVKKITLTNADNHDVVASFAGSYYVLPLQTALQQLPIKKSPGSHLILAVDTDGGTTMKDINF
jgi:fimbrial chaperone protein